MAGCLLMTRTLVQLTANLFGLILPTLFFMRGEEGRDGCLTRALWPQLV